ncbi:hypothetical protein [Pontibacter beigongshangensis]|uniref:hypothetical protein n=1 Tax=Pontibacter beigongshangensis TaxID=2574733 RepID=UPI0016507210|nr:hypothetical protein [Pontibacter beigongshangensis]
MLPKTIRINPKLTYPEVGVNQPIFEQHVKGKDLPVLDYENGFYLVEIDGEAYTVSKEDVALRKN